MFKPIILGGQDISSIRAVFDHDEKKIIVPSNRQIIYYDIKSGQESGVANISPQRLDNNEVIVACQCLDTSLYLFTNHGKIFTWSLETRDWTNELSLPIDHNQETLLSCKMLSRRQYIFTTKNHVSDETNLFHSMSRSERERPKQSELISQISNGDETSFDIGCCMDENDKADSGKASKDKLNKSRVLAFIHENSIYFQRIGIGEKFQLKLTKRNIDLNFTCVRANSKHMMVAAGDITGRIFLYDGGFNKGNSLVSRTKLHWHRYPVNDLCFSCTGRTLYSVAGESGCLVIWDLAPNSIGKKNVIPSLGMPIRHINSSPNTNCAVLSFEDNEIRFMDTDNFTIPMKTLTRRTYDMYLLNDGKALRFGSNDGASQRDLEELAHSSIGLVWHSKTDTLMTNCKTGRLQFYSPKQRSATDDIDCLKSTILSLEPDGKVLPSEITRASLSLDGDWLAFFETRPSTDGLFAWNRLHIWQRSSTFSKWFWVQTADRLHSTAKIADLKFSPDGKFLVSVGDDGRFQVLHRINLDTKSSNKQMYAKGFFGQVPKGLASKAAFSQDSSVLAISLKNENTLVWMIVDPYKLEYECQLNREDSEQIEQLVPSQGDHENADIISQGLESVLGLHFGRHEPSRSIAPLCEVRSRYIRIWNILNAQSRSTEMMEYLVTDSDHEDYNDGEDEGDVFTSSAFDQSIGNNQPLEHFAVSTKRNLIYLFELKINQESRRLQPLIMIDGSLAQVDTTSSPRFYVDMCFVGNPVMDIDEKSHQDPLVVRLINRLCLMTNEQELVSFTDKLTVERELAINSCNALKTYELGEVQEYFSKSKLSYEEEMRQMKMEASDPTNSISMTTKQRKIKQRLEVQKMLKDLFERIPSHNLPRMDILGPLILDKLVLD